MTLGAEGSPATFPYGPARSKSFQNLVSRVVHSFLLFHTVGVSGVQPVWSCHQERLMKHPDTQVGTPAGHLRRLFSVCHLPSDQMNPIAPVTCQPQRPTPITIQNVSPKNCHKKTGGKWQASIVSQFSLPFSGSSNFCKSFDLRARHPRNLGKLTAGSFGDVENWGITHVGPGLQLYCLYGLCIDI